MLFSKSCVSNSEQKWQTTLTKYTFFHLIILQLVRIDFLVLNIGPDLSCAVCQFHAGTGLGLRRVVQV